MHAHAIIAGARTLALCPGAALLPSARARQRAAVEPRSRLSQLAPLAALDPARLLTRRAFCTPRLPLSLSPPAAVLCMARAVDALRPARALK